jgi:hypothetical protein
MNGATMILSRLTALSALVAFTSSHTAAETGAMPPLKLDFAAAASAQIGFATVPSTQGSWTGGPIASDEPLTLTAYSGVSLAAAQEATETETGTHAPSDQGHFQINFALWAPGIDGTIGARGVTADVSATFLDILDDSNRLFGFGGSAVYRAEKFGAYLNGYWATIEVDETTPFGTATITNDIGLVGFGVLYEVGRWPMEHSAREGHPARDLTLTLFGGARFTSVSIEFDFPVLPSVSRERNWIDPMIGAQVSVPLSPHWSIVAGGDIGGFGAASDFAWSAAAAVSWDFHIKRMPSSLQFGYLAVGDDYSKGSGADEFVWDTILHGLLINFQIRF